MDENPVIVVNLEKRFHHAFKTGYACGRNGWGKQYNPYKRGEFHKMWLDGWGVGRAGYSVVLFDLDDLANPPVDKRARQ